LKLENAKHESTRPGESARPLFRREALEQLGHRTYGSIVLAHPVSYYVLTLIFSVIATIIILFFFFFSTSRKAQCTGVLVPDSGVIRIMPSQSGVVVSKRVKEGQTVRAGEVLFIVSSERASAAAGDTQKTISSLLEGRLESFRSEGKNLMVQGNSRLNALRKRTADLENEIARIDGQIALQQRRIDLSEQAYRRYSDLKATGYLSNAQLQDKQSELIDQQQRLGDLVRVKASNGRDLIVARSDIRDLELQTQRDAAAMQRNLSVVAQDLTENEARREVIVRSPQDGTISAINAELGQTVGTNSALATLLPAGSQLIAEVYAPSRSAGFVQPGMQVLLRYQAYPYEKFGHYAATVQEVANSALRPEELALATMPVGRSEPVYRIRLKLSRQSVQAYGRHLPLKSGMAVDASIVLEHRRLIEWVLEPLYTITGNM